MSETNIPQNHRQYEGPAELLSDHHDEFMLRENGPGGSYADHLTREYGPEGIGWGFDTADPRHAAANRQERLEHQRAFQLATDGLRNVLSQGRSVDNHGNDMTGKVQRYTRKPDMGNVVLYPDGKARQAAKKNERS